MSQLTTVNLPSLALVGGDFEFVNDPLLASLSFPLLTQVAGNGDYNQSFTLARLPTLTSFSAPLLTTLGGSFDVEDNTALAAFVFPLTTMGEGDFSATGNTAIPGCAFPAVKAPLNASVSIDGNAPSDGASCDNCPGVANPDQSDTDRNGVGDACQ
jgi:hypothetical protein